MRLPENGADAARYATEQARRSPEVDQDVLDFGIDRLGSHAFIDPSLGRRLGGQALTFDVILENLE